MPLFSLCPLSILSTLSILRAFPFDITAQHENDYLFIWHHLFTTFLLSNSFPAAFHFLNGFQAPEFRSVFHCPHLSSHIIMIDGWSIYDAFFGI